MGSKSEALATIAAVRARHSGDEGVAAVCAWATENVRTWAEPIPLAKLVASARQQEQFRLAERHGWKGGCDHLGFIPARELADFQNETVRLIAEAGDKAWSA